MKVYLYNYYQKFHNIFYRDEIRADQKAQDRDLSIGVYY